MSIFSGLISGSSATIGGNVGIGTSSPSYQLDMIGRGRIRSDGVSSAGHWLTNNTGTTDVFTGLFGVSSTDSWGVYSAGSWRFTVANGGNVGISSTNPVALLDVKYRDGSTNLYRATDNAGQYRWRVDQNFEMLLTNASGTDLVKIGQTENYFNNGNVGIGTTSPTSKLFVSGGNIFVDNANGSVTVRNADVTNQQQIRLRMSGTDGILDVTRNSGTSPNLIFGTEGTEKMRLDASGNLGIGTTNPSTKLQVDGSIFASSSAATIRVEKTAHAAGADNFHAELYSPEGSTTGEVSLRFHQSNRYYSQIRVRTGGAFRFTEGASDNLVDIYANNMYASGSVGIGTTSPSNKLQIQGNVSASSYTSSITGAVGFVGTASYAVNSANGVTINSNVDNYLVTATGTTGTLQGESNLTFDGTNLSTTGVLSSGTIRGTALYSRGSAASSGNILIQSDNGSSTAFWITAKTGGATLHIGGNGGSEPTAGAVIIDTSYNVGIGTAPTNNLDLYTTAVGTGGATIRSAGGGFLRMLPSASAGNYNSITSAGDTALIFSNGTQGRGRLVIAPWASATSGLVISGSSANVGIGTASPAYALDVNGDIRGNSWIGRSNIATPTADAALFRPADNSIALSTANTERVRINSSGNVGIGTTSPTFKLEVVGSGSFDNLLRVDRPGSSQYVDIDVDGPSFATGTGISSYSATGNAKILTIRSTTDASHTTATSGQPGLDFRVYNSTVLFASSSLNVGIGMATPVSKLHVYENTSKTSTDAGITVENDGTGDAVVQYLLTGVQRWVTGIDNSDGDSFKIASSADVGSDSRLVITTGGNVGIGTTSPATILDVNGSIAIGGYTRMSGSATYTMLWRPDGGVAMYLGGSDAGNYYDNSGHYFRDRSSNTTMFINAVTGRVGIGTTSPNTRLQVSSNIQGGSPSAAGTATTSSAYFTNSDTAYGILMGVLNAGHGWIQAQRTDTTATTYNLLLNPNGGNVGIGTTTPSLKLHVIGDVQIGESSGGEKLRFFGATNKTNWQIGKQINVDNGFEITPSTAVGGTTFSTPAVAITSGGNVGIGTISSAAKLHVSAASTNDIIRLTRTTDSAGSGFIYANSNEMFGVHDGTNYPFLVKQGATTNTLVVSGGNVGIGTTSNFDSAKLDVRSGKIVAGTNTSTNGSVTIQNYYTDGALSLWGSMYSSGGPLMGYGVKSSTTTANSFLSATSINISRGAYIIEGNVHRWYNGAAQTVAVDGAVTMTERMTMDANGNVGIGTTSPATRLHVQGTSTAGSAVEAFRLTNPDTGYTLNSGVKMSFYYGGTAKNLAEISALLPVGGDGNFGDLLFSTRTSDAAGVVEKVRIKANGKVGIGTTNPSNTLQIQGNVSASSYTSSINNAVGYFGTASWAVSASRASSSALIDVLSGGSTTGLGIYSGSFSGSFAGLGPGTVNNIALFNASRTVSSSVIVQSSNNIGVGISPSYKLEVSGSQRVSGGSLGVNVNPNATLGRIDAGNDIVAYSSDKRLKTNIELIHHSIDKVLSLNGFTFNWNDTAHRLAGYDTASKQVGIYAQEVQRILPEAVKLAPFDNDGTDRSTSGENYLTVQYEKLVPLLIEAIKELKAEVDELKGRLE